MEEVKIPELSGEQQNEDYEAKALKNLLDEQQAYEKSIVRDKEDQIMAIRHTDALRVLHKTVLENKIVPLTPQYAFETLPEVIEANTTIREINLWESIRKMEQVLEQFEKQISAKQEMLDKINEQLKKEGV